MAQKSEKIGEEEVKCQHMADLAQHDLDEALPALEEAMRVSSYTGRLIKRVIQEVDVGAVFVHHEKSDVSLR